MISRRVKIGLGVGAALGLGSVLSFGPLVRSEVNAVAERYGAEVEIDSVRPTWSGVRFRGVEVSLDDFPGMKIGLDEIVVRYEDGARHVSFVGGDIDAVGEKAELLKQLDAFRARRGTGKADSQGGGNSIEVREMRVRWADRRERPGATIEASGVTVAREDDRVELSSAEAKFTMGTNTFTVHDGDLALRRGDESYRVSALRAGEIAADWILPSAPKNPAPASTQPAKVDGAPQSRVGGGARAIRQRIMAAGDAIDMALEPDAEINLSSVSARLRRGDETLNLGPGAFSIRRTEDAKGKWMAFRMRPKDGGSSNQALTFSLDVPLVTKDHDAPLPISAELHGGPIHLSTLGVLEGDFGLLDVGKTRVEVDVRVKLSGDDQTVTVDGSGTVSDLSLKSKALASDPVRGIRLAWRGKSQLWLDGSKVEVQDGAFDVGSVHVLMSGTYERKSGEKDERTHRVDATFEMPLTPCQAMLDSAPEGLAPKIHGARMAGSFALKGHARFDTANLEKSYDVDWTSSNTCRITDVPPAIHVDRFKKSFTRTAYQPDGQPVEVESGPGTDNWVDYNRISRFMEVGVITCEDGRFQRHNGFDQEAIVNSIRENIKQRRFVRGASTISMQLAKNLYLTRGKNLSRKLQEAVLTMYLEQELTKEQILELYLNVVEFGPMVYGIRGAARHYFNSTPASLSLSQSMYLASILPSPRVGHFGAGGAVTPAWTKYLQTLMRHANKRHRLSDEDLEIGLSETVIHGSPAPRRARSESDFGGDYLDPFAQGPVDPSDVGGDWQHP